MATDALISVREYLSTAYSPDRDYVDGEVIERNLGEWDHASLQGALVAWFHNRRHELNIRAVPEQRIQVSPTRFRIPDVCVIRGSHPGEQILTSPPFICVEILSRDDRMSAVQQLLDDFGVPYVWLIDPRTRKAWRYTSEGLLEVRELRAENPDIRLPLSELFE